MKTLTTLATALFMMITVTAFAGNGTSDDNGKSAVVAIAAPEFVWGDADVLPEETLAAEEALVINLPDFEWGTVETPEPAFVLPEFVWGDENTDVSN